MVTAPAHVQPASTNTYVTATVALDHIAASAAHASSPIAPQNAIDLDRPSAHAIPSGSPPRLKHLQREQAPARLHPLRYLNYSSPVNVAQLKLELAQHPDRPKVDFVVYGLESGFRLMVRPDARLKAAVKNCRSSCEHPAVIDEYLAKESKLGRIAGPFHHLPHSKLQISRFGVIPKKSSGDWHLILDLSHPEGSSVNDGIDPDKCHTHYCKVDDAIRLIMAAGKGARMVKLDIKSAYRIIAVHPDDHYLLGMKWRNKYYIDLALPFGLRSAPFIFNSVADMLEWIIRHNYGISDLMHYLDDYFTVGPPSSEQCNHNLLTIKETCNQLRIPLAPEKCVGPTTCIVFLGIELDSIELCARLPGDKLSELRSLLETWLGKKSCTRCEPLARLTNLFSVKLRLNTAINRADFVSW